MNTNICSNPAFKLHLATLLALIAIFVAAFSAGAKDKDKPQMDFAHTSHDFGVVKEDGGPVSYEFQFTNTGKSNLVVISATAQCGCTKPEFPEQPIAPGKTGVIKVTYNPLGRPGAFSKIVTVKSNADSPKVRLKIKGTVMPK